LLGEIRELEDQGDRTEFLTKAQIRFQYGICCIAAPIAEEHLTGVTLDEQHNSYTDLMMAKDALARVTVGDGPGDIESIKPFTKLMIEHEWPHIQQLASELIRCKELDYQEVVNLLR
jgi:hypothetical protein